MYFLWSLGRIWGRGTCPKGLGTAVRFIWADSKDLATILNPFRGILMILGPNLYLRRSLLIRRSPSSFTLLKEVRGLANRDEGLATEVRSWLLNARACRTPTRNLSIVPSIYRIFVGVFGRGTGPKGSKTAIGFIWADSWDLATILDPLQAIFVILGPTPHLRRQQSELFGQDRLLLFQQRRCVLLKQDRSSAETRQMTAAETSVLFQQKTSVLFQQKTSVLF